MSNATVIASQADSLVGILAAQCADLEELLRLARAETRAAAGQDFEAVMRVVEQRAELTERLEVYHRRIAELRAKLGEGAVEILGGTLAERTRRLVSDIMAQDARTRPLLVEAFEATALSLSRLNHGHRGASAYLRDPRPHSIACDRRA